MFACYLALYTTYDITWHPGVVGTGGMPTTGGAGLRIPRTALAAGGHPGGGTQGGGFWAGFGLAGAGGGFGRGGGPP
jgi:hypothetical protein